MKRALFTPVFILLISLIVDKSFAQAVDETNFATRLLSITKLNIHGARSYFSTDAYSYGGNSTGTLNEGAIIDLYKYNVNNQNSTYLYQIVADSVCASGYITDKESEFQQIKNSFINMGFGQVDTLIAGTEKTILMKGYLKLAIQTKQSNDNTYYIIMLTDIDKVARLIKLPMKQ
jgi:hypothetical protein